jgi:hypothetical protein
VNTKRFKFLGDPEYIKDAYEALSTQFNDMREFEEFYVNLKNDQVKDDFLRVGSAFLFYAKKGDWHVNVERSNPVIDYFTNSFKLVSTLSIVEGLSNKKHIDFFQWLNKRENRHLFPLEDKKTLDQPYREYKKDYGAIHNVKDFFNNLSEETKSRLCKLVTINDVVIENIEELVKLIYQARSNFAHSTKHTLELSSGFHFAGTKNKKIVWKRFKFEYLLNAVEEGIVIHFKELNEK